MVEKGVQGPAMNPSRSDKTTSVLLVGVGGQGTILAGKVISAAAIEMGYDVKMSEVHGMAQRGGSVSTHVRWGPKVHSPLIKEGGADFIVAFESLEALRWIRFLAPEGTVIVNNLKIPPMTVLQGAAEYPDNAIELLRARASVVLVEAEAIARSIGSPRSANMVLTGVLASRLGRSGAGAISWEKAIRNTVPAHTVDANLAAFRAGWDMSP